MRRPHRDRAPVRLVVAADAGDDAQAQMTGEVDGGEANRARGTGDKQRLPAFARAHSPARITPSVVCQTVAAVSDVSPPAIVRSTTPFATICSAWRQSNCAPRPLHRPGLKHMTSSPTATTTPAHTMLHTNSVWPHLVPAPQQRLVHEAHRGRIEHRPVSTSSSPSAPSARRCARSWGR